MKISFMTFACPEWSLDQVIDGAKRHGYHGIEFRVSSNHAHGIEPGASRQTLVEARRKLDDAGIEACCIATSLRFINEAAVVESPALIELAAALDCPGLRVFCGGLAEGMTMQNAIDTVGENLARVAPRAESAGVGLWLETHDTFVRAADAAAAVGLADHPAVGINYDNMHPYRHGESLEITEQALGSSICHTHMHDAVNSPTEVTIKPLGEGDLPMDDMFKLLMRKGFAGYLSGEWFGAQYGADSDTSLAAFHRDMTQLARRNGLTLGD